MPSEIRNVETISAFDRDVKTLKKKHIDPKRMIPAVRAIIEGDRQLLATRYRDHALTGNWSGYRELHVEGDWLLIYFIDDDDLVLVLTRTGSHDELYSGKNTRNVVKAYRTAPRHTF